MCRSFAFMDTPNTPGECGAHKHAQVDKLIYHNCRVVSGRVGDIDKGAKREMYDSCMFLMSFDKANNNDCRVCEHDNGYTLSLYWYLKTIILPSTKLAQIHFKNKLPFWP